MENKLYLIEDSEKFWIVASSKRQARILFNSLYDGDCRIDSVKELANDEILTVSYDSPHDTWGNLKATKSEEQARWGMNYEIKATVQEWLDNSLIGDLIAGTVW